MKARAVRRSGYAHDVAAGGHAIVVDEPPDKGGADSGPTPTQLLAMSLAACTAITIEMYAERKGWDVGQVEVEVDYELDPRGGCYAYDVAVKLEAALDDDQLERVRSVAGKCPVHRALEGDVAIRDRVERLAPA